jgi:hypothetical protein
MVQVASAQAIMGPNNRSAQFSQHPEQHCLRFPRHRRVAARCVPPVVPRADIDEPIEPKTFKPTFGITPETNVEGTSSKHRYPYYSCRTGTPQNDLPATLPAQATLSTRLEKRFPRGALTGFRLLK